MTPTVLLYHLLKFLSPFKAYSSRLYTIVLLHSMSHGVSFLSSFWKRKRLSRDRCLSRALPVPNYPPYFLPVTVYHPGLLMCPAAAAISRVSRHELYQSITTPSGISVPLQHLRGELGQVLGETVPRANRELLLLYHTKDRWPMLQQLVEKREKQAILFY